MNDSVRRRVGQNVRAEMARRRVSQQAVADALGISQPQVFKRLEGLIAFDVEEIDKLANLLGISVADLLVEQAA